MTEATVAGTGTHNRSRVIRCRLPLRDDLSIDGHRGGAQGHLSPNPGRGRRTVHMPSTKVSTADHAWRQDGLTSRDLISDESWEDQRGQNDADQKQHGGKAELPVRQVGVVRRFGMEHGERLWRLCGLTLLRTQNQETKQPSQPRLRNSADLSTSLLHPIEPAKSGLCHG